MSGDCSSSATTTPQVSASKPYLARGGGVGGGGARGASGGGGAGRWVGAAGRAGMRPGPGGGAGRRRPPGGCRAAGVVVGARGEEGAATLARAEGVGRLPPPVRPS